MNAQDLKNSILQLAVQGKLVEQRPEEGTAKELLAKIKAEKEQLIKDKKIKKEKPLPEITEEEIPFDIPESWEWVRLGDCISLLSGQDMTPDKYNSEGIGVPYLTGASNISDGKVIINRWTSIPKAIAVRGNLLVTCKGTIGTTCILEEEQVHIARQIMAITSYGVAIDYIHTFIQYYVSFLKKKAKSMIPGIERKDVLEAVFPLPPLAEQKRIVAKIEEILPYIEQYDKAYTKLETFNKKFPEDMKKSILQMAMQGKLVEQRSEEGTADELYEQILVEKERLIKEGKIKKEKPLAEITEDEIPFEIPENWKWVRLGGCVCIKGGKRLPQGKVLRETPTKHIYIRVTDMKNQSIDASDLHYIDDETYEKIKNYIIEETDLYIVIVGSTIGKVGAVPHMFDKMNLTENAARIIPVMINKEFLLKFLMSDFAQRQFIDKTKQVGQPKLAMNRLENTIVPVPPLAEQKRIVAKLEQMLLYCDQLIK